MFLIFLFRTGYVLQCFLVRTGYDLESAVGTVIPEKIVSYFPLPRNTTKTAKKKKEIYTIGTLCNWKDAFFSLY